MDIHGNIHRDFEELLITVLDEHCPAMRRSCMAKINNYARAIKTINDGQPGTHEALNCIYHKYRLMFEEDKRLSDHVTRFLKDGLKRLYRGKLLGEPTPFKLKRA